MNSQDKNSAKPADRALDRLLGKAPALEDVSALKGRIMVAAANAQTSATARIITFAHMPVKDDPANMHWGTAALLAASLFIGIWAGASGAADALVSAPLSIAGLDILGDSEFYKSGLSAAEELL